MLINKDFDLYCNKCNESVTRFGDGRWFLIVKTGEALCQTCSA